MYLDTIFNSLIPFQPPFSHLPHSRHGLYAHPHSRYWPLIFHPYRSRCILSYPTLPYATLLHTFLNLSCQYPTLPCSTLPYHKPLCHQAYLQPTSQGSLVSFCRYCSGPGGRRVACPPPPPPPNWVLMLAQRIDGRTLNNVFRISVKTTLFAVFFFFLLLLLLLFFFVCVFLETASFRLLDNLDYPEQ